MLRKFYQNSTMIHTVLCSHKVLLMYGSSKICMMLHRGVHVILSGRYSRIMYDPTAEMIHSQTVPQIRVWYVVRSSQ